MRINPAKLHRAAGIAWPVVIGLLLVGLVTALVLWAVRHRQQERREAATARNVATLTSTNQTDQKAARKAVAESTPEEIAGYIKTLDDVNQPPRKRSEAARALGVVGKRAGAAFPSLLRAAGSDDRVLKSAALYALGRVPIDPAQAIPVYVQSLKDADSRIRQHAAFNLGRAGTGAKEAIPALMQACKDPDEKVRATATNTLAELGAPGF